LINDAKGSQLDENLVDLLCCEVVPLLNKCDELIIILIWLTE